MERIIGRRHKIEKLKKALKKKNKTKSGTKNDENSWVSRIDDSFVSHVFDY